MNKTTSLRTLIRERLLKTIEDSRLYEGFNSGVGIPKVNYKLVNMLNDDECDEWLLELNIWASDSLLADNYADNIENVMNFISVCEHGCHATFYLQGRRTVEDSDPKIERRMMTYSIENYYKEETNEE